MKNSPDELEKFIHQTLRSLPERSAPRTLEARVLAAIDARAALPWWKHAYADWPLAARIVFLVVSGALAKLALMAAVWVMGDVRSMELAHIVTAPMEWFALARRMVEGTHDFALVVLRNIPAVWLYGTLASIAAIYATLFGLGATAYRTLYHQR